MELFELQWNFELKYRLFSTKHFDGTFSARKKTFKVKCKSFNKEYFFNWQGTIVTQSEPFVYENGTMKSKTEPFPNDS